MNHIESYKSSLFFFSLIEVFYISDLLTSIDHSVLSSRADIHYDKIQPVLPTLEISSVERNLFSDDYELKKIIDRRSDRSMYVH